MSAIEDEEEKIKIVVPLNDRIAYAGDRDFKLHFEINDDKNCQLQWFRDDVEIKNKKFVFDIDCRVVTLHIKHLEAEDGGRYKCVITRNKEITRTECTLTVRKDREAEDEIEEKVPPPKFHHLLRDLTVKKGEVMILCVTNTTMPGPDCVEWYKNNERITIDNRKFFGRRDKGRFELELLSTDLNDGGIYKVIGKNNGGSCESSCTVTITEQEVTKAPEFHIGLMDETSQEKQLIKLEAYLIGSHPLVVNWFKDGIPIEHDERVRIVNEERIRKFSLVILDTLIVDTGNYKLVISNKFGQAETTCHVTIQSSKIIQRTPEKGLIPLFKMPLPIMREVPEMIEVSLVCAIVGAETVTWTKDSNPIGHHVESYFNNGVATLIIRLPTKNDSGTYCCCAVAESGSAACTGSLFIQEAKYLTTISPKFIEPLTNVSVMEGGEIILKAQILGKPNPTLIFYKDGLKMLMNNRMLQYVDRHGNVRLNILDARIDDMGEYTIEATDNEINKDFTHCTVSVIESALPMLTTAAGILRSSRSGTPLGSRSQFKPTILRQPPPTIRLHEGNKALLEVELDNGSEAKVEWFFENKPFINSKLVRTYFDGRIAYLKFYEANKNEAGTYEFKCINSFGQDMCKTEVIIEGITIEDEFANKMPKFTKKLENVSLKKLGESILLKCTVAGPDVIVKFLVNGRAIYPSYDINFNSYSGKNELVSTVEFIKITKEHLGTITATAINSFGEAHNSCELVLEESQSAQPKHKEANTGQSPQINKALEDVSVNEGETGTLSCNFKGELTEISWFKNGVEIIPSQKHSFGFDENGNVSLVINNCQSQDAGTYVLSGCNDYGSAVDDCKLVVNGILMPSIPVVSIVGEDNKELESLEKTTPRFARPPPDVINIGEGKKLQVTVKAAGHPKPLISFRKDGKQISRSSKIYQSRVNGNNECVFTIECPVLKSSGLFTAVLENSMGTVEADFQVVVTRSAFDVSEQDEQMPYFKSKLQDIAVFDGHSARIECELAGFPDPSTEILFIPKSGKSKPLSSTWDEERKGNFIFLTADTLTTEDEGTIQIIASNILGKAVTECYVLVGTNDSDKIVFPKIILPLQDTCCKFGEDAEFELVYEGSAVTVKWYHEGLLLKDNLDKTITFEENKCKLSLRNVTLASFGQISATISSIHGKIETSCYLKCGSRPTDLPLVLFSQDDELTKVVDIIDTPVIKKRKRTGSSKRKKSRDRHHHHFSAPAFVIGLEDMNLKSGDAAAVGGKLAHRKRKVRGRDEKYDESRNINEAVVSGSHIDISQNAVNRDIISPTTPHLNFDPNTATLEDVRLAIAQRNKTPCRPKFFVKPKAAKTIDEFKSLRLKAAISGSPIVDVSWDKNGIILESGSKYSICNDGDFIYLEVHNLSEFDSGSYNLNVKNSLGYISCSSEIDVIKASPEKTASFMKKKNRVCSKPFFTEPLEKKVDIEAGNELILECIVAGYPVCEVTFFKNNHLLIPQNGHIEMSYDGEHGTLKFYNILKNDEGIYSCKIENSEGFSTSEIQINVKENPNFAKSQNGVIPKFVSNETSVQAIDGESCTLIAELLQGSEPLGYQWIHNKIQVQDSSSCKYSRDGKKILLKMRDAFPEDSGLYICKIENGLGSAECNVDLNIVEQISRSNSVENKPLIVALNKKLRFKSKSVGEIILKVISNSEPVISWLNKDREQILASHKFEMISKKNEFILRIHNFEKEDAGNYYLMAVTNSNTAVEKVMVSHVSNSISAENSINSQFTKKIETRNIDTTLVKPKLEKERISTDLTKNNTQSLKLILGVYEA
uniref:Ig-like domain-containing protein n=1 Tax=Rhabditophanes sp. KR3021 TaxID=114890 RepID=A0AC35UIS1_9BILA